MSLPLWIEGGVRCGGRGEIRERWQSCLNINAGKRREETALLLWHNEILLKRALIWVLTSPIVESTPTTRRQGEGRWRDNHHCLAFAVARVSGESPSPFSSACLYLIWFSLFCTVLLWKTVDFHLFEQSAGIFNRELILLNKLQSKTPRSILE